MSARIEATVYERGNGFPDVGDLVVEPVANEVYRIVELRGPIHTGPAGAPNYIHALVEAADWDDVADDDEPSCGVSIDDDDDDSRASQ